MDLCGFFLMSCTDLKNQPFCLFQIGESNDGALEVCKVDV